MRRDFTQRKAGRIIGAESRRGQSRLAEVQTTNQQWVAPLLATEFL
ncbi:MAG TPA: hypothetical protein VGJ15_03945 [Pirellulales bacterium]